MGLLIGSTMIPISPWYQSGTAIYTNTGVTTVNDGSNTAGVNEYIYATLGAERVVDGTFSVGGLPNWTLGAGWADGGGKAAKNAAGVGTLSPAVAINAVIGTTYKVTYQVLDWTVGNVTVTYGGISDVLRGSDGNYVYYLTANTASSLVFTPDVTGSRFSIDNVSVKALTDNTGDLEVQGDLVVRSSATIPITGSILQVGISVGGIPRTGLIGSTAPYPGLDLVNSSTIVARLGDPGAPVRGITLADTSPLCWNSGIITQNLSTSPDLTLYRDAANTLAQRRAANAQSFKLYTSYTDAANYERLGINTAAGTLTFAAETLGTGTDDMNLILIPAGLGLNVSTQTTVITAGVTDGYIAGLRMTPTYNAATPQTVTRHNYFDLNDVTAGGAGPATVTDAMVFRFNANPGTHKALASPGAVACTIGTGPAGANAGNPLGWMKINVNGTKRFVPYW